MEVAAAAVAAARVVAPVVDEAVGSACHRAEASSSSTIALNETSVRGGHARSIGRARGLACALTPPHIWERSMARQRVATARMAMDGRSSVKSNRGAVLLHIAGMQLMMAMDEAAVSRAAETVRAPEG